MRDVDSWIPVSMVKPPCKRNSNALGIPVLIWPRNPSPQDLRAVQPDGFCYYGKRATGHSTFYLYGAEIYGVKFWQPMPKGPAATTV